MRQIKFRGITPDGYPIFGGVSIVGKNAYIVEGFSFVPVKTVSQLIATDINGCEVYEDDLIRRDEKYLKAEMTYINAILNGDMVLAEALI